jgi:hypothetical protein
MDIVHQLNYLSLQINLDKMTRPKFLYIDDEKDPSVEAIRDGFNDVGQIEVFLEQPQDFKTQKNDLLERLNEYDGLILDLRLDGNMLLDVSYNAPAIAQELRTDISNKEFARKPKPIVLCSTDEKMRATYDVDKASHDLFDYKFLKGSDPNWGKFSNKLFALAVGYNWLNENERTLFEIFGREDILKLDPRITDQFNDPERKPTTNDYAQFFIEEMFHHPGPLIKENILAARLGIDISTSGKDWNFVRDKIFEKASFTGIFSTGWKRWWADTVNNVFKEITDGKKLASLKAEQRVKYLSEKFGLKDLKSADPLKYCNSTEFWTICEGYKKPIDPLEAFIIYESAEIKPWQDSKYISFDAVINRIGVEKGLRPLPSEIERIELMKKNIFQ